MNRPETDDRITELWDEIPTTFGSARAALLMELGEHLIEADRPAEALPVVETAEALFTETIDDLALGHAAHNRAIILGRLRRPEEQLAAEHESIVRFERAQRLDFAGCSRMALAHTLCLAGRLEEALAIFEAAEANFSTAGAPDHRANALMSMLETLVALGRFSAATRLLQPTLVAVTQSAPIPAVAQFHGLAAHILEVKSEPAAATKALRQARAIWEALDDEGGVAACDIRTAVLSIGFDSADAAATTLHTLRGERQDVGDVAGVAACDRGIGLADLARNRPHQAERRFEDASAVFAACALFGDAAECDALGSTALAAQGRSDEAIEAFRQAIPALAANFRPRAELTARIQLGRLLLDAGAFKDVAGQAKRALSIARRGGLGPERDEARALEVQAAAQLRPQSHPEPEHAAALVAQQPA